MYSIQDTKTFSKCYVGRNGRRKLTKKKTYNKSEDPSSHNGVKGAKAKHAP